MPGRDAPLRPAQELMPSSMQRQVGLHVDALLDQGGDAAVLVRDRDAGTVAEAISDRVGHVECPRGHRIGAPRAAGTSRAADSAVADAAGARGRALRAARPGAAAAAIAAIARSRTAVGRT